MTRTIRTSLLNSHTWKQTLRKLVPQRQSKPRFECQYCCERKRANDFVARAAIPYNCQIHLGTSSNMVCKACFEASMSAQLDSKPLLEIGCPQCGVPWDPDELKYLIGCKNEKRFKEIDRLARDQVLVPSELPDGATIDVLMTKGAKFCPWCRWPFIKTGGCDAMQCVKCFKCFNISYALLLEDQNGNRAARIGEEEQADEV